MVASSSQDLNAWLRLALIPELTPARARELLAIFPTPATILDASNVSLGKILSQETIGCLRAGPDPQLFDRTLRWLDEPGRRFITIVDDDYPNYLKEIPDAPPFLYVNGDHHLLNRPSIAVVGSRNPTAQGLDNAYAFAKSLGDNGLCVVSGLALGVDARAHAGGLDSIGRSVAVLGTGLDLVYPARNRELAHRLAKEGTLISEFPLGIPALAANFPRRNRIISGLCLGCLVVEAAPQSGSLITARLAAEQGRDVFAIPGSIHSPLSKGCHSLIKQGAKLVETAQDVLEELGVAGLLAKNIPASGDNLSNPLLDQIGYDPVTMDALSARTSLRADQVAALVLELELSGHIARLPGGRLQRVR